MEEKRRLAAYLDGFLSDNRRALFDKILAARTRHVRMLVADPNDPGDAFAVMRSCEIFGVQNYHVIASEKVKTSKGIAVGSSKWVTLGRHFGQAGAAECVDELKAEGYLLAAVNTADKGPPIRQMPLDRKMVLCLSGDAGLPAAVQAGIDMHVHVPVRGFSQGYNLSVLAALSLADVRFALERSNLDWRLSEAEQLDLRLEWLAAAPKKIGLILERYLREHHLQELDRAMFTPEFCRLTGL